MASGGLRGVPSTVRHPDDPPLVGIGNDSPVPRAAVAGCPLSGCQGADEHHGRDLVLDDRDRLARLAEVNPEGRVRPNVDLHIVLADRHGREFSKPPIPVVLTDSITAGSDTPTSRTSTLLKRKPTLWGGSTGPCPPCRSRNGRGREPPRSVPAGTGHSRRARTPAMRSPRWRWIWR